MLLRPRGALVDEFGVAVLGAVSGGGPVESVSVDSVGPVVVALVLPERKVFTMGESLAFTVRFSEPVAVDTDAGVPILAFDAGDLSAVAELVSVTGDELVFSYALQPDDVGADPVVSLFELRGAVLTDLAGNAGLFELPEPVITGGIGIDARVPSVDLSFDTAELAEGGSAKLTASLVGSHENLWYLPVTVSLGLSGDAVAGADYELSDSLIIPAGESSVEIILQSSLDSDLADAEFESVAVEVLSASGLVKAGVAAALVIHDNDIDGDGIENAVETTFGFDPRNPLDALEDADRDGGEQRA